MLSVIHFSFGRFLFLLCLGLLVASPAYADVFLTEICSINRMMSGYVGKAIAAVAIIGSGVGFFNGKVSMGIFIGIAAGMGLVFGAPTIISAVSDQTAYDCTTISDVYDVQTSDCMTIAQGNTQTLTAPSGVWRAVTFASYGLPVNCSVGKCDAVESYSYVANLCLGKSSCDLNAQAVSIGIPVPTCKNLVGRTLQVKMIYY